MTERKFWKSQWGIHLKIAIIVYVLICISLGVLTISLYQLPWNFTLLLSLPWIFLYLNFIFIGLSVALFMINSIKPLFYILLLNDAGYLEKIKKTKIPKISITLPLYLLIFYIYFIYFNYDPLFTLGISWITLIIVRTAHYANNKMGHIIGGFVGSFFLPFGFMTLVLKINDFIQNQPSDLKPTFTLIFTFILIIFAQFVLEIIMDYLSSKDKKHPKKKSINANKLTFPKMTGKTKYYIIKAIILFFLIISISLIVYFTFIKIDQVTALGFLSVSIAIIAIYLGHCSDRRMIIVTTSSYNLLFADFNLIRLEIRKKLDRVINLTRINANTSLIQEALNDYLIYHSYSIWICNRFVRSFLDFEEHLKDNQKLELIHEIDNYFIDFCIGKSDFNIQLDENYKEQLQRIVDTISTFKNFTDDDRRVQRILINLLYLQDEGPITFQDFD